MPRCRKCLSGRSRPGCETRRSVTLRRSRLFSARAILDLPRSRPRSSSRQSRRGVKPRGASVMKDQETETPLHRDRFGKTEEAVALLGYSDVVNFIKSEGFRTAV